MDSVGQLVFLFGYPHREDIFHFAYCLNKHVLGVSAYPLGLSSFSFRKRPLPFCKRAFVRLGSFEKALIPVLVGGTDSSYQRNDVNLTSEEVSARQERIGESSTKSIQYSKWVVGPLKGEASCVGLSEGVLGIPITSSLDSVSWESVGFRGSVGPWDMQKKVESLLLYKLPIA